MKQLGIRSCAVMIIMAAMLSGCSSHCSCPPPAPASTTVVTPRD